MKKRIKEQVRNGRHDNDSHYALDPVRRDQAYQDERAALIRALVQEKNSGVTNRSIESIWQDIQSRQRNTWLTENAQAINTCNELAENNGLFAASHRTF